MPITPFSPAAYNRREGVKWTDSQYKVSAYPGYARMKINSLSHKIRAVSGL